MENQQLNEMVATASAIISVNCIGFTHSQSFSPRDKMNKIEEVVDIYK